MKALNFVIFTLIFVVKVEGDEEWNGGRPPPFFPQGKGLSSVSFHGSMNTCIEFQNVRYLVMLQPSVDILPF